MPLTDDIQILTAANAAAFKTQFLDELGDLVQPISDYLTNLRPLMRDVGERATAFATLGHPCYKPLVALDYGDLFGVLSYHYGVAWDQQRRIADLITRLTALTGGDPNELLNCKLDVRDLLVNSAFVSQCHIDWLYREAKTIRDAAGDGCMGKPQAKNFDLNPPIINNPECVQKKRELQNLVFGPDGLEKRYKNVFIEIRSTMELARTGMAQGTTECRDAYKDLLDDLQSLYDEVQSMLVKEYRELLKLIDAIDCSPGNDYSAAFDAATEKLSAVTQYVDSFDADWLTLHTTLLALLVSCPLNGKPAPRTPPTPIIRDIPIIVGSGHSDPNQRELPDYRKTGPSIP